MSFELVKWSFLQQLARFVGMNATPLKGTAGTVGVPPAKSAKRVRRITIIE
jgi:hypothetical protein